jgi:hypothetical protein
MVRFRQHNYLVRFRQHNYFVGFILHNDFVGFRQNNYVGLGLDLGNTSTLLGLGYTTIRFRLRVGQKALTLV